MGEIESEQPHDPLSAVVQPPKSRVFLTAEQMRKLEDDHITAGRATGFELMERAARGIFDAIRSKVAHYANRECPVYVLCGPGNNGGDGFAIARLIAQELDVKPDVYFYGDVDRMQADARTNYDLWCKNGSVNDMAQFPIDRFFGPTEREKVGPLHDESIVIDAVFGTGLKRPVTGHLAQIFHILNQNTWPHAPHVVAVDMPSGICADSGRILGTALKASQCYAIDQYKRGHVLDAGADYASILDKVAIGLDEPPRFNHRYLRSLGKRGDEPHPAFRAGKSDPRKRHKYDYGSALVLSGGMGKSGAARLAARGALRIGAGVVTIGAPIDARAEIAAQITSIMMCQMDTVQDLRNYLAKDPRISAICMGPGMGVGATTRDFVRAALDADIPMVLDADAITSFVGHELDLKGKCDKVVMTPHIGEFRALFPNLYERATRAVTRGPAYSWVDAANDASRLTGAVVVLKSATTVIGWHGHATINANVDDDERTPWLSTAGAGDVLAGFITGLLARGIPLKDAAETSVFLHAQCARTFGPCLIAEDLPDVLPKVMKNL